MVAKPKPVKLISGLLSADTFLLEKSRKLLEKYYGRIDMESPVVPFDYTDYYDEELGKGIMRQFVSFDFLFSPEYIGRIKRHTIRIERKLSVNSRRRVNLDPGFIALDKLVVATTKDATYRIYIGKGIYAQSMLFFQNKGFMPWQWTYPDYKSDMAIDFFNKVREIYKELLHNVAT